MRREYEIKNLHCAGCASKIQYELDQRTDIKDVSVDYYLKKLKYTLVDLENENEIFEKINIILNKIEEGTYLEKNKNEKTIESNKDKKNDFSLESISIHLTVIGITLFLVGLSLDQSIQKSIILILSYILTGYDILLIAFKNIKKGKLLDENFLMSIATIGAMILGEYGEAAGVMIFYKVGEYFQEKAVNNSKKSIEALLNIKPEFANLKTKDGLEKVNPEKVKVRDIIVIKVGERIPLDGMVKSGTAMLDKSALTGESNPVLAESGSEVLSGSIVVDGMIDVLVQKPYSESTVNRIIDMVENSVTKKAEAEKFITKFARYYTPIVVVMALVIGVGFPFIFAGGFKLWISRALIFLVISCPCALVISVPLTFFSSIGSASKKGILVKGGNYLERLKNIDKVVFDKTGTLTKGKFKVVKIESENGYKEEDILNYAKIGEFYSNHPIAKAILETKSSKEIEEENIIGYNEKIGYGTYTKYQEDEILVGNLRYLKENGIEVEVKNEVGTEVCIALNNKLIGRVYVEDVIKETSIETIKRLEKLGIETYMLTGDNKITGEKIANQLGMKLENVFTKLLPQDKLEEFKKIKSSSKEGVVFVGDGINDAPVLAISDVGISMGELGSDIAIESSDIVIMKDEPIKIVEALELAKLNNRVVFENIVFALGIKIIVMILGVLGIANLWLAIFADVGVSVLAVINASKILKKN